MNYRRCCYCGDQRGPYVALAPLPDYADSHQPNLRACYDVAACSCRMRRAGLTPRDTIPTGTGLALLERLFRAAVEKEARR